MIIHTITHLFINLLDRDVKFFYDLTLQLYNFVSDGTHDKIKTCQAHEAGGLKMVGVKSFLSAFNISWLKRVLRDNGKIRKKLQTMCPSIQRI